ncbi:TetR family transcriptional regulator [Actinomycetes bacterium M1A6_2h]
MAADAQDPDDFRMTVMLGALDLFESKGYEATTVDEIADAAGISRRTFFRQFRAKEDVVFVDHDIMLAQVADYLSQTHADPRAAVAEAAARVFERFAATLDTAHRRYTIVKDVPTLRDREIVMIFRYEGVFMDYLRRALPMDDDLELVQFAAAVTATHNYLLRRTIRDDKTMSVDAVRAVLSGVHSRFESRDEGVVVAVFPRGTTTRAVTDVLAEHLDGDSRH